MHQVEGSVGRAAWGRQGNYHPPVNRPPNCYAITNAGSSSKRSFGRGTGDSSDDSLNAKMATSDGQESLMMGKITEELESVENMWNVERNSKTNISLSF